MHVSYIHMGRPTDSEDELIVMREIISIISNDILDLGNIELNFAPF